VCPGFGWKRAESSYQHTYPTLAPVAVPQFNAGECAVKLSSRALFNLCLIASFCFVTCAKAQTLRPLKVQEALGVLAFANRMPIALSPDGEWVAYTVEDDRKHESTKDERYTYYTRTGAFTEALGCDVWITNTKTGESQNLTHGEGTSSSPVWSPDGKYLAFFSDRNDTEHLWLWARETGKMRQLSDAIVRPFFNFQVVRWSNDSRTILVKVLPEEMTVEQAADLMNPRPEVKADQPKSNAPTVTVYTSLPKDDKAIAGSSKRVNDETWMNRYRGDLALVDVASGKIDHIIKNVRPLGYWFSPDGRYIAYTNWKGIEDNTQQPTYEIGLSSLGDRRSRILVPGVEQDYGQSVSWAPDSKSLAYLTSKGDCYVVALDGSPPQNLTSKGPHPPFHQDHRAPLWDSKGENIYLVSTEDYGRIGSNKIWAASPGEHSYKQVAEIPDRIVLEVTAPARGGQFWSPDGHSMIVLTRNEKTKDVGFVRVDPSRGTSTSLFEEPRYPGRDPIFTTDVSQDGTVAVYVMQDAQDPEDIWVTGHDFKDRRQLTHINPQIKDVAFGKTRIIDWRGIDGQQLHGALLLPANYQEGSRYPLIVNVYGGSYRSETAYRFGLSGAGVENLQLLSTRGYAVLLPDTPLRKGTPMQDLLKTVMPGVDRVVDMGIADPDHLGIMGHSYGGYSTLALVVQTTRFRAAVDSAGPADLISFYGDLHKSGAAGGIGWSETGQGGMVGSPWQFRDRYIENSPLFYLDRVETPLLIIQGELDPIWKQADEVFVGLRRLGKEAVYAKYAGEDHWEGTWSTVNMEDYWTRVIDWFDSHLSPARATHKKD
jgi:dipeptidyl aminopeptidase/acylaminoacyl peptidase